VFKVLDSSEMPKNDTNLFRILDSPEVLNVYNYLLYTVPRILDSPGVPEVYNCLFNTVPRVLDSPRVLEVVH
jgi:hypothetical protein